MSNAAKAAYLRAPRDRSSHQSFGAVSSNRRNRSFAIDDTDKRGIVTS